MMTVDKAQSASLFRGLSNSEAQTLLATLGPNTLPQKADIPLTTRFLRQFRSPLIYILLFALAVDITLWSSEGASTFPVESVAIALILLLNAALGVYQEGKAEAALAKLKDLSAPFVWVIRDGTARRLPSSELVPGDVVRIEAGDRVPADGKLLKAEGVSVDESVLTGESLPVDKVAGDEVLSGTLSVRGRGYALLTLTGEQSSMGRLASLISAIDAGKTPLELRLAVFGRQVAFALMALAFLLVFAGLLAEGPGRLGYILLFAVALAVAAVPEGLPAVLTLTLSLGVERMARRKAVVRRLSAVEALGSITVIATDKTGTLTENRMFVKDLDSSDPGLALRTMVLANDAELPAGVGDPLELALLQYAQDRGIQLLKEQSSAPRRSVLPFESEHKFMRVTVEEKGKLVSYAKGAPEVILGRSHLSREERRSWEEKAIGYATEGFRILALGWCEGERDDGLCFGGLVLLWDPPRAEVPDAIRRARQAGIRVVMITGDHPATALSVADEVGIPPGRVLTGFDVEHLNDTALREAVEHANVFARVTPVHKLRLVEALQANEEVVAVTGDGVNDAPALKRSDIGVAMGKRGSDVAREVADLVLLDDNFATIVAAIEEGRNIYENIQKFIRFFFSTDLALIILVVGGSVGSFVLGLEDVAGGILLPLTAIQLLWINLIADGPPALALGLDRNDGLMNLPPRDPRSMLLDRPSLAFVVFSGVIKASVGGALLLVLSLLGFGSIIIRTTVFLFESIAQIVFAYPARHISAVPRFNPTLHLAVALGVGIQITAVLVPALRDILGLSVLDRNIVLISMTSVLSVWVITEIFAWQTWRIRSRPKDPSIQDSVS